jgi:hypothetical protein
MSKPSMGSVAVGHTLWLKGSLQQKKAMSLVTAEQLTEKGCNGTKFGYGVTVNLVSSLSLRYFPVIKVSPGATAVANPDVEMVATAGLEDVQSVMPVLSSSR